MINRELIRQKVVQVIYSYFQNGSRNIDVAEKELELSLSRAYRLYASLLLLIVEVGRMGLRMEEIRCSRARRLGLKEQDNSRFSKNRFLLQLEGNRQLRGYVDSQKLSWADHEDFVRKLYLRIEGSEIYAGYMEAVADTYADDREFWRKVYRKFFCDNDELDDILEDMDIYWNDDKVIVDTFVLKTIKQFSEDSTDQQPLEAEYLDERDHDFAVRLLRHTITGADTYTRYISSTTRGWDVSRIALMDRVIMLVALAEIVTFPDIPLGVSINEYVELAKTYSSPKSGKYVNATLDTIAKRLASEHKLVKDTLRDARPAGDTAAGGTAAVPGHTGRDTTD